MRIIEGIYRVINPNTQRGVPTEAYLRNWVWEDITGPVLLYQDELPMRLDGVLKAGKFGRSGTDFAAFKSGATSLAEALGMNNRPPPNSRPTVDPQQTGNLVVGMLRASGGENPHYDKGVIAMALITGVHVHS